MRGKITLRVSFLDVLLTVALILSYLESIISFGFIFPGFRLGLSNITVVVVLYFFGARFAVPFGLIKSFFSLMFLGRFSSLFFSMTGMVFSLIVMILLRKIGKFSIYSVSACGSVFHIWGQIFAAAFYLSSLSAFIFIPWLSLLAVFSGIAVGWLSNIILSRLNSSIYGKFR